MTLLSQLKAIVAGAIGAASPQIVALFNDTVDQAQVNATTIITGALAYAVTWLVPNADPEAGD